MLLRPYQSDLQVGIDRVWARGGTPLAVLPTGCHRKGQALLQADGTSVLVEDVRVGDKLMGPNGQPRNVLVLARGQEEMVRVLPVKGSPFVVNRSHVLSLVKTAQSNHPNASPSLRGGTLTDVSIREWETWSKTKKHLWKLYRVSVEHFHVSEASLPLDPYFLGVLLGDGSLTQPRVSVSKPDPEISAECKRQAQKFGLRFYTDTNGRCPEHKIVSTHSTGCKGGSNEILNRLRALGLSPISSDKRFVPSIYKTASWQARHELLAGLLDTDGSLAHSNYDFVSKSKQLTDDVAFIARSLGLAAQVVPCEKYCQTGGGGTYYRLCVSGDTDRIPCRISRKIALPRAQKKNVLRTGFSVEPLNLKENYYGFTLDDDGRYLLDDFTVTHNSGKTVVFARILRDHKGPAVVIAHRRELVGQISLALAREGVLHRIIAPNSTVRAIVRENTEELGHSCYSPTSDVAVASVDSIGRASDKWRFSVTLWIVDEAHHPLRSNKWGRAIALFPNAKGLGVTATPERADGKGLGKDASGVFTHIVAGPPMRELIDTGYLSDYTVYAPPSTLDVSQINVSRATGDYSVQSMQTAVAKAQITGDVVAHYLRLAPGKLGITFAVSVAEAELLASAYRQAGVPAAVVSAKTPATERTDIIRRFKNRELLQLVNVDIFGEGFDLPAIEVVSFVRPTKSFPLYCQSFGRALRPLPGKDFAIIIDHVGNVVEHGLPDAYRVYSLKSRDAKTLGPNLLSLKVCPECARVFKRIHVSCPYCHHVPVPTARSTPAQVDGDLVELDAATLQAMRDAVARVDLDPAAYAQELFQRGCPEIGIRGNTNRHRATQEAQERLRLILDWWRGVKVSEGLSERESYKAFYLEFSIDVLSARALSAKDADELCARVRTTLPFAAQCMTL